MLDSDVVQERPQVVGLVRAGFRSRPRERPRGEEPLGGCGERLVIETGWLELDPPIRRDNPARQRRRAQPDVLGGDERVAGRQAIGKDLAHAPRGHTLREEDLRELRLALRRGGKRGPERDARPTGGIELRQGQPTFDKGGLPRIDGGATDELGRDRVAAEGQAPPLARLHDGRRDRRRSAGSLGVGVGRWLHVC